MYVVLNVVDADLPTPPDGDVMSRPAVVVVLNVVDADLPTLSGDVVDADQPTLPCDVIPRSVYVVLDVVGPDQLLMFFHPENHKKSEVGEI